MRRVECEGGTVELLAGALTPQLWASNFGDRFSEVALGRSSEPLDVLRLAYTLAATADVAANRETPAFHPWLASLGGVDLVTLREEATAECVAGLFRDAAKRREHNRQRQAVAAPAASVADGPVASAGADASGGGDADGR